MTMLQNEPLRVASSGKQQDGAKISVRDTLSSQILSLGPFGPHGEMLGFYA